MRGIPLLRAILLVIALGLTSILVAAVLSRSPAPLATAAPAAPASSTSPGLVPAFIQVTLSAPATTFTFTEPSGRVITLSPGGELTFLHDCELAIDPSTATWDARLSIEWQEPAGHHFARIDLEPHQLKTATLVLDFPGNVTGYPINARFGSEPRAGRRK